MGWGGWWEEIQKGGDVVHLWLIDTVVWQKPTQHCKTIIPQLKRKEKYTRKTPGYVPNWGNNVRAEQPTIRHTCRPLETPHHWCRQRLPRGLGSAFPCLGISTHCFLCLPTHAQSLPSFMWYSNTTSSEKSFLVWLLHSLSHNYNEY